MSLEGIADHLQAFLQQLPALIDSSDDLGNLALAQQFSAQTLPNAQAAELLWHAHLAGHPSGYLDQLQSHIQACTREALQLAAQQLNDATGGWRCVANGPCSSATWQAAG